MKIKYRFKQLVMALSLISLIVCILSISSSKLYGENLYEIRQDNKKIIRGKIIDSNGMPLPGATVMVGGTTIGTVTDTDGNFILQIPNDAQTLQISFVGMKTLEIPIAERTTFNVQLEEEAVALQEVVAVGYGTQKKINLTGAVTQVDEKVLANRTILNVGQGLQGTIGNLNIITNPGDPGTIGQGASFNIRGTTSINGGSPLILIDGVPGDINSLNPSDIENIAVLKDASSAAIYGSRATYGVILVETKKGSVEKTIVSYNGSITNNFQTQVPKTVNSLVYANVINEACDNSGRPHMFSEEHIERIKKFMADPEHTPTTIPEPGNPNMWSYALGNDNVDWFKTYYANNVIGYKNDLSISGGSKNITYRVSGSSLEQNGILKYGKDKFNRTNFSSNVKFHPLSWLKFDFSTLYARSKWDEPYSYSNAMGNWFHVAYTRQPHWPLYDPNGFLMWTSQIQYFQGSRQKRTLEDLWIKGGIVIEPIADLEINARYSWNKVPEAISFHEARLYAHYVDGNPYPINPTNSIEERNTNSEYTSFELFTNYTKNILNHSFGIVLGGQWEKQEYFGVGAYRKDLVSDDLPSLNTATGVLNAWDSKGHWANIGIFGRLNYNYKERYLLEFNSRYDGTSKFPKDRRWGLFPSFSIGWNIAKEDFFKFNRINTLKLRASYGELGNQQVANYMFYNTIPIGRQLSYLINGERPNYLPSPGLVSADLTWETAKTRNIGLDFSALGNRIEFSFDWYIRETLNMIGVSEVLPAVLGAVAPKRNNANLSTKGWELSLSWRDMIGDKFQYGLGINLSDNTTEITKYINPTFSLNDYYEGMTIGEIWGYKTHGLIQTQDQLEKMADQTKFINALPWKLGDIEYMDLNGDKVISPGDRTLLNHGDLVIIGNNNPRYQFGIFADASWKYVDFRIFFQGTLKRDVWLSDIPFFGITGSWTQVVFKENLDYWTPDNTDAYFAKPYITDETLKNQQVSDRYLQNAAYIRLKNVQIGYTFRKNIIKNIQKMRIYLNGENLFHLSPLDKRFDPERVHGSWGPGKVYPILGNISGGISIDF